MARNTYSAWDGWDLVQEYQGGGAVTANYLYGATGLVKESDHKQLLLSGRERQHVASGQ